MRVCWRAQSRACACVRVNPERLRILKFTIISRRRYSSGGRSRSICRWRSDVWLRYRWKPASQRCRKMSLKNCVASCEPSADFERLTTVDSQCVRCACIQGGGGGSSGITRLPIGKGLGIGRIRQSDAAAAGERCTRYDIVV